MSKDTQQSSTKPISPLRKRMIEEMEMRKLAPKTQRTYLLAVEKLANFLGRSPHTATREELRLFQLHLVHLGNKPGLINSTLSGLRFLFETTLKDKEVMRDMATVRDPRKVPQILSIEEVELFISSATSLKHKALLGIAYGSGLRIAEISRMRVTDIDADRMVIRVNQGKWQKDRYTLLSKKLFLLLRAYWRELIREGLVREDGWLFPGKSFGNHMTERQISRICRATREASGLQKPVTMHILRHCFSSHLLELGVDIRVIQSMLGHKKLDTTAHYTQVTTKTINKTESPMDQIYLGVPT